MKRGDYVFLESEGEIISAIVVLASENGESMMVMFKDVFMGYVAAMPLTFENGCYRDLMAKRPVLVTKDGGNGQTN